MKQMRFLGAVATATLLAPSAYADADGVYSHGHMSGGYDSAWMMLGPLIWIVAIGMIAWVVMSGTRWSGAGGPSANAAKDALDMRFANGEIDAAEYAERKKLLS